jgi:hypothetical protein
MRSIGTAIFSIIDSAGRLVAHPLSPAAYSYPGCIHQYNP